MVLGTLIYSPQDACLHQNRIILMNNEIQL